jgi:hypothetical protein
MIKFTIWYSDGIGFEEYGETIEQAVIKSMAKRINNGEEFSIDYVEHQNGINYELVDFMRFEKLENIFN